MKWTCHNCKKELHENMGISVDAVICKYHMLYYCGNCYKAAGVGLNSAAYVCFARPNHKECAMSVDLV